MRRLIAAMKTSLDQKIEGPDGYADWVEAWSEDYGLTPRIDACLLGGGMYGGYEQYWSALQQAPDEPLPVTGRLATAAEMEWARVIPRTPHYVLSTTLDSAAWPNTHFLRHTDDVAALKAQPGRDIYLVGGARTTTTLMDAGLVDELHLIVHPLIAGEGTALLSAIGRRHRLELLDMRQLGSGRVRLSYGLA